MNERAWWAINYASKQNARYAKQIAIDLHFPVCLQEIFKMARTYAWMCWWPPGRKPGTLEEELGWWGCQEDGRGKKLNMHHARNHFWVSAWMCWTERALSSGKWRDAGRGRNQPYADRPVAFACLRHGSLSGRRRKRNSWNVVQHKTYCNSTSRFPTLHSHKARRHIQWWKCDYFES